MIIKNHKSRKKGFFKKKKEAILHNRLDVKTYDEMKNTIQDYMYNNNDAPNDNITTDKHPAIKGNKSQINIEANKHFEDVCDSININYEELVEKNYSDKCY